MPKPKEKQIEDLKTVVVAVQNLLEGCMTRAAYTASGNNIEHLQLAFMQQRRNEVNGLVAAFVEAFGDN